MDLRDRSNSSTPVGYASSLDGSEDVGFLNQSTSSLPRSRPTSRGSIGSSQREGLRPNVGKKKKKPPQPAINESWEQDSILRSLKEEIEEDMLEDIEEDTLSVLRAGHSANLPSRVEAPDAQNNSNARTLPRAGVESVDTSRTTVRPLPPQPKTGAFETVVSQPEVKSEKAGVVVLTPVDVADKKSGCSCTPFFCRGSKSQVAPMCQTSGSNDDTADFSSKVNQNVFLIAAFLALFVHSD